MADDMGRASMLVRVGGKTLAMSRPGAAGACTVLWAKRAVWRRSGVPVEEQRLLVSGRDMPDNTALLPCTATSVEVRLRLVGGKGGFGSMLRALGSQRSGAETDNIDACRDLSGRRLRHVNDEKKIAEWMESERERQEEVLRRKREKLERALLPPKHTFDHHSLLLQMNERSDEVAEAMASGKARAAAAAPSSGTAGAHAASSSKPNFKRTLIRDEWEDEDSSDDDAAAAPAATKPPPSSAGPQSKETQQQQHQPGDKVQASTSVSAPAPTKAAKAKVGAEANEAAQAETSKKRKRDGVAPAAATAKPAAAEPVLAEELNLGPFASAEELKVVGLDRLKAALMHLGVKCGGTLDQRAERLFSLKGVAVEDIPKQLLAGGAKKGKRTRKD
eukprot:m.8198 g.8198  ORF g.8198 m.8198 type:complete len:389 (+) comp3166_c0_seq1:124-1290(+)